MMAAQSRRTVKDSLGVIRSRRIIENIVIELISVVLSTEGTLYLGQIAFFKLVKSTSYEGITRWCLTSSVIS